MTGSSTETPSELAPSVLVVLVVRDAAGWLRGCLSALGAQTYPRMGVVAVDDASSDGSSRPARGRRWATGASSPPTVTAVSAGSVRAALEIPAARAADYLLVLHDDTALDPDAVTRLVEAAIGMRVENVGVVGPEGRGLGGAAAAPGGRPLRGSVRSPVHAAATGRDRSRAVRSGDRSAVRLDVRHVDLARGVAAGRVVRRAPGQPPRGSRLLLARPPRGLPRADDAARAAPVTGTRRRPANVPPERHRRTERYYEERAAIVAMLKNYGLPSLLWVLPLAILIGVFRLAYLTLTRRFEGALDLLAAWGWNIVHLPGTISRRVRTQSVRTVPDRHLRRFMESTGRTAAALVHRGGTDLRRAARDRGAGRGRVRQPAAARPDRFARRVAPRPGRVVPRRVGGRGRVQATARAGAAARRGLGDVPGFVARVLRRAGVRLPDDRARRHARGESRRSERWARSRGSRSGARRSRRRCCSRAGRSWRPSCCIERSRASPAVRARPSSAPSPTDSPPWCCGASRTAASRSWWRCASCPSSSSGWSRRSGEANCPTGGGGSSPASR